MKNSMEEVRKFLDAKNYIFYGISSNKSKFSNSVVKHLVRSGSKVYPVHPEITDMEGIRCYKSIEDVENKPESAIIFLSPENTEKVLPDIVNSGIKNIWIQQRSESEKAISFCRENGINLIHGECILMFSEPVTFIHKVHRWINRVAGKLPA
ncbi:MAG: CoA-binding protein [Ignavibacteria bacterium]|jgi:hypothetical protein|nr:CoA-binding protein [Ignavibacteria bacterium]